MIDTSTHYRNFINMSDMSEWVREWSSQGWMQYYLAFVHHKTLSTKLHWSAPSSLYIYVWPLRTIINLSIHLLSLSFHNYKCIFWHGRMIIKSIYLPTYNNNRSISLPWALQNTFLLFLYFFPCITSNSLFLYLHDKRNW